MNLSKLSISLKSKFQLLTLTIVIFGVVSLSNAATHTHNITGSTGLTGSGTGFLAKYYSLAFIMKILENNNLYEYNYKNYESKQKNLT